jgi:hypothetical protein
LTSAGMNRPAGVIAPELVGGIVPPYEVFRETPGISLSVRDFCRSIETQTVVLLS